MVMVGPVSKVPPIVRMEKADFICFDNFVPDLEIRVLVVDEIKKHPAAVSIIPLPHTKIHVDRKSSNATYRNLKLLTFQMTILTIAIVVIPTQQSKS